MRKDQQPAQAGQHGHLKESLKKQGKSEELAEQIAAQTVAQAAVRQGAASGEIDVSEKDTRKQNRSLGGGQERRRKNDVSGPAQRRK